jgi:hypothetical protein
MGSIFFSSAKWPYCLWKLSSFQFSGYRDSSAGAKRTEPEHDHSPLSSVEVKHDRRYTSKTLYVFTACTWVTLTFTLYHSTGHTVLANFNLQQHASVDFRSLTHILSGVMRRYSSAKRHVLGSIINFLITMYLKFSFSWICPILKPANAQTLTAYIRLLT